MDRKGRPSKRWYLLGAAVCFGLWLLFAWVIAPALIRDAYRGASLELLNRIISGQETHPVESYLDAWRSLAGWVTALLVAIPVVWLWIKRTERGRGVVAWALGGGPGLGPGQLLRYAATVGAVGGLAEGGYLATRQLVEHAPAAGFYSEILWMAPLSASISFLLVALVPAALAWAANVKVAVSKATFVLGSLAAYGVLQSRGIPLHPFAEVILALGLGATLSRFAAKQAHRVEASMVRWSRYVAAVVVVLAILGLFRLPSISERRALASLPQARSGLPNILLIILDTVRSRNLSLYGYQRPTTPRLDEWARSGVVFERAVATAPWTLPTHASMFTGRYHFEVGSGRYRPLDARFPTLAEALAAQGYATGGFVANLIYTTETSGLQRGFARYEDFPVTVDLFISSSWFSRYIRRRVGRLLGVRPGVATKNAEQVTAEFLDWMDGKEDGPFFAFLNYMDAHIPYRSPEPFHSRFGPPPPPRFDATRQYSPEELEPFVNAYDGAISYIDWHLGVVFDTLAARGLLDRTLVIVTSDHGEMFGEHGQILHNNSLYMPELHVPLAISLPKRVPENVWIAEPVTLRDLPATVLDLAGVAGPSPFPGLSLAKSWAAPTPANEGASPILAELDGRREAESWQPVHRGDLVSILEDSLHYIRNGDGVEELYNFHRDPAEQRDLSDSPDIQPALIRLRATLDSILQ